LIGTNSISLNNFLASEEDDGQGRLPGPSLPFIQILGNGNKKSTQNQIENERARIKKNGAHKNALLLVIIASLFAASGFTIGHRVASRDFIRPTPVQWRVIGITKNGAVISVAGSDRLIDIPTGGIMPNGEKLISVDVTNQRYKTPTQTVTLDDPGQNNANGLDTSKK